VSKERGESPVALKERAVSFRKECPMAIRGLDTGKATAQKWVRYIA